MWKLCGNGLRFLRLPRSRWRPSDGVVDPVHVHLPAVDLAALQGEGSGQGGGALVMRKCCQARGVARRGEISVDGSSTGAACSFSRSKESSPILAAEGKGRSHGTEIGLRGAEHGVLAGRKRMHNFGPFARGELDVVPFQRRAQEPAVGCHELERTVIGETEVADAGGTKALRPAGRWSIPVATWRPVRLPDAGRRPLPPAGACHASARSWPRPVG
jgi:hypothetical protein